MLQKLYFTFLFVSLGFIAIAQEPDYSMAKIGKKTQGVYIFINAEPVQQYDFIATVEVSDFWAKRTPQEAYERLITKSKNKYPNFNGIIFHNDDFHKADLIKFKGLEVGGGGFHVGDKITYKEYGNKIIYGEVIAVNNSRQEATFKYLNEYNAENNQTVKYVKLQPITEEEYTKAVKNAEGGKKIYTVGQKISWTEFSKIKYGVIQEVNIQNQKAVIKYMLDNGQEKIKTKSLSDIFPANETDYQNYIDKIQVEVNKHKFKVGDKVKWIRSSGTIIHATVILFNETTMNATIKYNNDKNLEKNSSVDAFDLIKDE